MRASLSAPATRPATDRPIGGAIFAFAAVGTFVFGVHLLVRLQLTDIALLAGLGLISLLAFRCVAIAIALGGHETH